MWPVVGPCAGQASIQKALDSFVTGQLVAFEDTESLATEMRDWIIPPINYAGISGSVTMAGSDLFSVAFECHYNYPGAATSFQQNFGMIFSRRDGHRWLPEEIFVRPPAELPSLRQAFFASCAELLGDAADPTGLPTGADFVISDSSLGVCTTRYDVGPGYLGAPIIWIPHDRVARLYSQEFECARLAEL